MKRSYQELDKIASNLGTQVDYLLRALEEFKNMSSIIRILSNIDGINMLGYTNEHRLELIYYLIEVNRSRQEKAENLDDFYS